MRLLSYKLPFQQHKIHVMIGIHGPSITFHYLAATVTTFLSYTAIYSFIVSAAVLAVRGGNSVAFNVCNPG